MFPDRKTAIAELEIAGELNPGLGLSIRTT